MMGIDPLEYCSGRSTPAPTPRVEVAAALEGIAALDAAEEMFAYLASKRLRGDTQRFRIAIHARTTQPNPLRISEYTALQLGDSFSE
jgi:hypothetical protein